MTQLGKRLAVDVARYLETVDAFRAAGIEPSYRAERFELIERQEMSRREIRAQTERVER